MYLNISLDDDAFMCFLKEPYFTVFKNRSKSLKNNIVTKQRAKRIMVIFKVN